MRIDVLTIFPHMIAAYLKDGVLGRAVKAGILDIRVVNIRDFADDPHKTTDDRPYGGGDGMVMKAAPIFRALKAIDRVPGKCRVILLSPKGRTFDQNMVRELSKDEHLILVCGRYEGVDERIRRIAVDLELSIGDYILSGGELGALVVMDAVGRLIPGVLGGERSSHEDSFENELLDHPHFTRPRVFEGKPVPQVLLSGNHEMIRLWRRKEALRMTLERRPDLLKKARLNEEDRAILAELREEAESLR